MVVDDTQIIVLGGLIEDQLTDGSDKVPLFGDIPIAGALFRYDARRRQKTNLMIFIKPTVLRTSADGREITSERYQYLQGEQERQTPPNRLFWGDPGAAALPPRGSRRPARRAPISRRRSSAASSDRCPAAAPAAPPRSPEHALGVYRWPRSRRPPPPDSRTGSRTRSRVRTACWRRPRSATRIVVLTRPDATVEGLAGAEARAAATARSRAPSTPKRFAAELARAYNVAGPAWRR